jgi:hypothetical protein
MMRTTSRPGIEELEPRNTPSTTVLLVTPKPALVGQSILLTAIVTESGTDSVQPGAGLGQFQTPQPGGVIFYDGNTPLGPPVSVLPSATKSLKGSAQFQAAGLAVGSHNFTAVYSGELQYGLGGYVTGGTGSSSSAAVGELVSQPVPVNVTPSVTLTRVVLRPLRQRFTLHNNGATVPGPVFVILRGLPARVTLTNAAGKTTQVGHLGDPFVRLDVNPFLAGQNLSVLLTFANPRHKAIVFRLAAFAGLGAP